MYCLFFERGKECRVKYMGITSNITLMLVRKKELARTVII